MKRHYHNPHGKNNFVITRVEARLDGWCKVWATCEICNLDWRWQETL